MARDALAVLQASVTKTSSFNSTGFDLSAAGSPHTGLEAVVVCTAASGTSPTLDCKIQESADNSTFNDLAVCEQLTAAGRTRVRFSTTKRYVRLVATIGGTSPSFTYESYIEIARK